MKEYEDEAFCDNCQKYTPHLIHDSEHERDSSNDHQQCLICHWTWFGLTGTYEPPPVGGWEQDDI